MVVKTTGTPDKMVNFYNFVMLHFVSESCYFNKYIFEPLVCGVVLKCIKVFPLICPHLVCIQVHTQVPHLFT